MSWRLFHAIFAEGLVMSRDVLRALACEVGIDGAGLIDALDDPAIAVRHEAALDRALLDGAFGVPSFSVAGQVFWGNDRLPLLERVIAKSRSANL